MKKMLRFLLLVCLLLSLGACSFDDPIENPVEFYYPRRADAYLYGSSDGVITGETRDVGGAGDLKYLLTLYLQGPLDEFLVSPFPSGSTLLDVRTDAREITLILDAHFATLSGLDQTIACVCLARTCFGYTDAQSVRIIAGGKTSIDTTISIDSLPAEDDPLAQSGT